MSCNFLLQEFWVFWIRYVIIVGSRIINRRFSRVQARHYADHVTNSKGSKFLQEKLQPMQLSEFDSIVQKVLPFSLESIRSYLQILLWGRSRGVWLNLHLKPSKHVPFRDHTDLNFQVVTLVIIYDLENCCAFTWLQSNRAARILRHRFLVKTNTTPTAFLFILIVPEYSVTYQCVTWVMWHKSRDMNEMQFEPLF